MPHQTPLLSLAAVEASGQPSDRLVVHKIYVSVTLAANCDRKEKSERRNLAEDNIEHKNCQSMPICLDVQHSQRVALKASAVQDVAPGNRTKARSSTENT